MHQTAAIVMLYTKHGFFTRGVAQPFYRRPVTRNYDDIDRQTRPPFRLKTTDEPCIYVYTDLDV